MDDPSIKELLRQLFDSQRFGVLATESAGQPHASLMAFAASEDLEHLVFATARDTLKFVNLQHNRRVAMLIDNRGNEPADTRHAVAVTATGEAEEVEGSERSAALGQYLQRHPHLRAFAESPGCAVMRMRVEVYQVAKGLGEVSVWRPGDRGYEKCAHLYDLFDQKPNLEFFLHYAAPAGETLDVGAGTGRIALPLAERGIHVCCVEPSLAMRRELEKKLARRPDLAGRIRLIEADARSFDAGRTFPAAFLSGSFDHFVDDRERLESLANVGRHLVPGGTLVFDVFLGLMKDSPLKPAGEVKVGQRQVRRLVGERLLPGARMEVTLVFEVHEGGKLAERIEERSLVGITDRQGVHRVLEESGFEVRREWSSYEFAEFQEGDPLLIVEAVKRD